MALGEIYLQSNLRAVSNFLCILSMMLNKLSIIMIMEFLYYGTNMTTNNISLTNTNLPGIFASKWHTDYSDDKLHVLLVLVFIREINFDFEDNNATVPKAMKWSYIIQTLKWMTFIHKLYNEVLWWTLYLELKLSTYMLRCM